MKLDNLCELETVGPAKQQLLRENGYETYEDLAKVDPFSLKQDCDLVLSSATKIISGSIEELHLTCPECGHNDFNPRWAESKRKELLGIDGNAELICKSCTWFGTTSAAESAESPRKVN